ncbi:hypothetical protein KEM52_000304 [Ascosphaera acerosa]|nr:hypothetical protein KEM52_000304 [Ascosphaera acerosa]
MPPKGRPSAAKASRPSNGNGRASARGGKAVNTSILSFFKKSPTAPSSDQARITQFLARTSAGAAADGARPASAAADASPDALFFEEHDQVGLDQSDTRDDSASLFNDSQPSSRQSVGLPSPYDGTVLSDADRYHENGAAVKRRRLSQDSTGPDPRSDAGAASGGRRTGPFVDDSDDEDGPEDDAMPSRQSSDAATVKEEDGDDFEQATKVTREDIPQPPHIPSPPLLASKAEATCPICESSLDSMTETEVSQHVNQCLDATMSPAPSAVSPVAIGAMSEAQSGSEPAITPDSSNMPTPRDLPPSKATGKAGQQSPFSLDDAPDYTKFTAFSRIMTENAEASAWAAAAAREVASRGKRAAERTCPFYKIMPGFSICVDAFRYGAVEGCEAYFLSHYHSDHYIGLTKTWNHGPIYCSQVTANLVMQQLGVDAQWVRPIPFGQAVDVPSTGGAQVTMLDANHCPGSSIFLFEKRIRGRLQRILHCGDFRAHPHQVLHPSLAPECKDPETGRTRVQGLDAVYLDTTYLNPKYAFPNQSDVINTCAEICLKLDRGEPLDDENAASALRMSEFVSRKPQGTTASLPGDESRDEHSHSTSPRSRSRLCVVIGTYSIGKERICLGIARALKSKIYASAYKQRITRALEDSDLTDRLTSDPHAAQVHMHSLMEIRPETLSDYLTTLKPHFTRIVGFRPTGWTYRSPKGRMLENPDVDKVIHSKGWQTPFSERDCKPLRGSSEEAACFGIPYSEHSSFRELTMFCCSLRIAKIVPTVNVSNATSRDRMKKWIERWEAYKRTNGLYVVKAGATRW